MMVFTSQCLVRTRAFVFYVLAQVSFNDRNFQRMSSLAIQGDHEVLELVKWLTECDSSCARGIALTCISPFKSICIPIYPSLGDAKTCCLTLWASQMILFDFGHDKEIVSCYSTQTISRIILHALHHKQGPVERYTSVPDQQ